MKPARFEYHRPGSLRDALALLGELPDAKPLAGGQSLIPAMNFRLAAPGALVDLNAIEELAGISPGEAGSLRLGGMTRHRMVETSAMVAERAPLLAEAMPWVAHPQIRTRGTVGGSLAHADPAAELPAVMAALEATLVLRSAKGERRVPAEQFFTGLFATALEPGGGELIAAVEIPALPARAGWAFLEVARRHGDYALVGVAVTVVLDVAGNCERARIALLSVGEGPVLARGAMAALSGQPVTEKGIRNAADRAGGEDIDPPTDIHASSAFRRQLAAVLTRRALGKAFERAKPQGRGR